MSRLRDAVEEAIAKVDALVPDLTSEQLETLKDLHRRMQALRERQVEIPDGVHKVTLDSEHLRVVRDGLAAYRNIILPAMMKREVNRLRAVLDLTEAADQEASSVDGSESPT